MKLNPFQSPDALELDDPNLALTYWKRIQRRCNIAFWIGWPMQVIFLILWLGPLIGFPRILPNGVMLVGTAIFLLTSPFQVAFALFLPVVKRHITSFEEILDDEVT